jgi:periplasmic protein TonB
MQTHRLSKVDPVYPPEAQQLEGVLLLRVHIDKDGNASQAERISGPDLLVPAATEAVKGWKYQPYMLRGSPIEVETRVNLTYSQAATVAKSSLNL